MTGSELLPLTEEASDKPMLNTIDCRFTKPDVTRHNRLSRLLDRVIVLMMVVILLTLSFPACVGMLGQETSSAEAPHNRAHFTPHTGTHTGRQAIYSA